MSDYLLKVRGKMKWVKEFCLFRGMVPNNLKSGGKGSRCHFPQGALFWTSKMVSVGTMKS